MIVTPETRDEVAQRVERALRRRERHLELGNPHGVAYVEEELLWVLGRCPECGKRVELEWVTVDPTPSGLRPMLFCESCGGAFDLLDVLGVTPDPWKMRLVWEVSHDHRKFPRSYLERMMRGHVRPMIGVSTVGLDSVRVPVNSAGGFDDVVDIGKPAQAVRVVVRNLVRGQLHLDIDESRAASFSAEDFRTSGEPAQLFSGLAVVGRRLRTEWRWGGSRPRETPVVTVHLQPVEGVA